MRRCWCLRMWQSAVTTDASVGRRTLHGQNIRPGKSSRPCREEWNRSRRQSVWRCPPWATPADWSPWRDYGVGIEARQMNRSETFLIRLNACNCRPISYLGVVGQGDRANLNLQRCPNSAEMTGIVRHEGRIKDNGMGGNHDIVESDITSRTLQSGRSRPYIGAAFAGQSRTCIDPKKASAASWRRSPRFFQA